MGEQLELFSDNADALAEQLAQDIVFAKKLKVSPEIDPECGEYIHIGGRGNRNADIMFIALKPSAYESESGEPYSDMLGAKLMQAVETYANLDFNEVYCTYLIKYAEYSGNIKKAAMPKLREYMRTEIAAVKPKYIVCLGSDVYKIITGLTAELDQYCGTPVYYKEYGAKVSLIWSPLAVLSMPEAEHNWIIDLKLALERHMPDAKSNWQEQDKLPTWRPTNMQGLNEAIDAWLKAGAQDFAIDTEFEPRTEWQDHILFKITISSAIGNMDLHIFRPKYPKPFVLRYADTFVGGKEEFAPEHMIPTAHSEVKCLYSPTREDVLEFMRATGKDYVGYLGEYEWAWEDGSPEDVAKALTRMTDAMAQRGDVKVWAQNGHTDYKLLLLLGWNLLPYIYIDIITLAHTIDEHQRYALEALSRKYLGAPSHKFALIEWLTDNHVNGGKLPYSFVPREIIDPYATTDSRRTYDLAAALLAELDKQDAAAKRSGEPLLRDGYFNSRMPEYFNLIAMEVLGEPINPYKLVKNIQWYEDRRKSLLREIIAEVKALTRWPTFNPDSAHDLRKLLFDVLKLTPIYSTGKPQLMWDEVLAMSEKERYGILPSTDGETLRELSNKHPLCKKLYTVTKITTIVKNYLRKGVYWGKTISAAGRDNDEFTLEFDTGRKAKDKTKVEKYLDGEIAPQDYQIEKHADNDSKSLSLNVHRHGYVYTTYSDLLETMRLATRPNMSALPKEESREIQKLVGDVPPYEMRMLIEPGYTEEDFEYVRKQSKYAGIESIVYARDKASRDWYVIESDWNTGEVWYLVAITGDKTGVETLSDPSRDVHATMARSMFPKLREGGYTDMEIKKKFPDLRSAAKPFVFGIPYGRGAPSLIAKLNSEIKIEYEQKLLENPDLPEPQYYTIDDGFHFIESYHNTFQQGWDYLEEQKARVVSPGYLVSPWGFKRRFPRIPITSKYLKAYQREASNWQIQHGIGCCRMEASKAYLRVRQKNKNLPCYMISILHDASKYLVHASVIDEAVEIIDYVMGDGMCLPFKPAAPLRHSMEISDAWHNPQLTVADIKARSYAADTKLDRIIPTYMYAETVYESPAIFKHSW